MNPTDTPNACPHCGMAIYSLPCAGDETTYWKCGTDFVEEWGFARSAECYEKELAASKAEVKMLNNILENTRESRDTMIEDRNLLDQELTSLKAEVERLHAFIKKCLELLDWTFQQGLQQGFLKNTNPNTENYNDTRRRKST